MQEDLTYIGLFNKTLRRLFRDALRIGARNPRLIPFLLHTIKRQKRAAQTRLDWEARGLHVPPFLIASITNRCNLRCHGCYSQAHHRSPETELTAERWGQVMSEARDLGISIILLAGGEPLARPEILEAAAANPEIVFPVFTNGTLLDSRRIDRIRKQRNLIPVLSLEGRAEETDTRRGPGVHAKLKSTMSELRRRGVFFGASLTLTRENFSVVTERGFIEDLIEAGCRLFFFVDYVPVAPGTEDLIPTEAQRLEAAGRLAALREDLPGLFIALPGDEEQYGGCLAAGRGFVHLSAEGRLEPCPFSPYSDVSVKDHSLQEALGSPLLRAIRENSGELSETAGGCALWAKREWVSSLTSAKDSLPVA